MEYRKRNVRLLQLVRMINFNPMGILIPKLHPELAANAAAHSLNFSGFLRYLVPVTLGNIVGGKVMVGMVYWFIYLLHLIPMTDKNNN